MSVIRDLINEVQTATPDLLADIEMHTGITIESGKIQLHVIDEYDTAMLRYNGECIGMLEVDYSEPCLRFRGFNFE